MIFTWHPSNKNNKNNNRGTIAPTNNKIKNAYQIVSEFRCGYARAIQMTDSEKKRKKGKTTNAKLHNYCYEFGPTIK